MCVCVCVTVKEEKGCTHSQSQGTREHTTNPHNSHIPDTCILYTTRVCVCVCVCVCTLHGVGVRLQSKETANEDGRCVADT